MIDPGPYTLSENRAFLLKTGDMEVRQVTPAFFADLQKDHPAEGGSLISNFSFDEP